MRLAQIFFLALFCATALFSCKKDDEDQNPNPQPQTYDNYSALKVGNYWIYEYFEVDSMGNAVSMNKLDSCYVKNDTVINGKTYFHLVQPSAYFPVPGNPYPHEGFLRDSLHYIVNPWGKIVFSSEDFSTVFREHTYTLTPGDTAKITKRMENGFTSVSTPAGTFNTLNAKTTYNFNQGSFYNDGAEHSRYAKNTGLVIETMPMFAIFFHVGRSVEKRLIRYHVQP